MIWQVKKRDGHTAKDVYELCRHHRLHWHNLTEFLEVCRSASIRSEWYDVSSEDGEEVGVVLLTSITPGESATMEFIPNPKMLVGDYKDAARRAIVGIAGEAFSGHGVRRVTAAVPYSRFRTRRALKASGFVQEGKLDEGVHLSGFKPEDLYIFGMTARKYREQKHGNL